MSVSAAASSLTRHRSFVRFWCARTFTNGAYMMQGVAVGWQIYALTNDPLDLGLVGLVQFFPLLATSIIAGQVLDLFDRRVEYYAALVLFSLALFAAWRIGSSRTGFWLEGKWTTLTISREETPREPRMMWIASSWPRVVIRPTRAPFLWISAFVPTVVPWVSTAISPQNFSNGNPRRSAATCIAASMPSAKLPGVEGALVAVIPPPRPSTTQSVNVPPMSTPTSRFEPGPTTPPPFFEREW